MAKFPSTLLFFFSCDADPSALAKYVLALVKKDKSEKELKALCIDQLDVFLQKGKIFGLKILVYFNKSFKARFSIILKELNKITDSNCNKVEVLLLIIYNENLFH